MPHLFSRRSLDCFMGNSDMGERAVKSLYLVLWAFACFGCISVTVAEDAKDPASVLEKMRLASKDICTLCVDFEQIRKLANRRHPDISKGILLFSRDLQAMRWETTEPEISYTYLTPHRMVIYIPEEERAEEYVIAESDSESIVLSIMRLLDPSSGNWEEFYEVSQVQEDASSVILELIPKDQKTRDLFPWIRVELARATWRILRLVYGNDQGEETTMRFHGYKTNPDIAEDVFEPNLPEGTWIDRP